MVLPNYACATGIMTFKLEQPIGLQLACVGSKSTISYGTKSTITFGNQHVDKYFDMANIDFYDVILGTPFLRWLKITLDFSGPGVICMGTDEVPRNIPPASSDTDSKAVARSSQLSGVSPSE